MSDTICFRCDWSGDTDADHCPSCGAAIHRDDRTAEVPKVRTTAVAPGHARLAAPPDEDPTPGAVDIDLEEPEPDPSAPLARRRVRGRSVGRVAVVVGVVVVAWMVVVGSITPTPSAKLVRSLHGSLVFTTGTERPGRGQLWVVDLDTGEVRPGPHVPTPTAVVRVPEGGYLVSTADGAWFLSSLDARVRPRFLAGRRTVGLAGDGRGVFVSSSGHITGGRCDYSVLESVEARSGDRERLFTSVCARVRNVGSDGIIDYLTLASDTGSGVYALGYREIHPVLRGYELLSVSPQGDLLVAPSPGDEEVVLFWQGRGSPVQVRSEGAPLEVEHALAWSTDGARAALLGSIRGTRAVWSIGSGPSARGDRPVQVSPRLDPDEVPGAAFDPEGRLFLATGGSLWAVRHGLRNEVPLPEDIPEPSGPLLWLP